MRTIVLKQVLFAFILIMCSCSRAENVTSKLEQDLTGLEPIVDWNNVVGKLTDKHWGVNDQMEGMHIVNDRMAEFYEQISPGIIRIHTAGLVELMVNNEEREWNEDIIREKFENAKDTYKFGDRIMLCLDDYPDYISKELPLKDSEKKEIIELFGKLPGIIKKLGYRVDMYEFFNEKESRFLESYDDYWYLLNNIAKEMKKTDPDIMCGGPAVSWPSSEIYKGFIDNCAQNMDFISFHLYARGPGEYPDGSLFSGEQSYVKQADVAGSVIDYLKEKKVTNLEVLMDEFNVQYVWTPYEPTHHNSVGAAWMACLIKNVAIQGITGLNVWNTQDSGAYGLNYTSAPARLYQLSNPYLRGDIVYSIESSNRVEMIPVVNESNGKSILFINKSDSELHLKNVAELLECDEGEIRVCHIDETTKVSDKNYDIIEIEDKKSDIVLHPYGLILVTNVPESTNGSCIF